MTIAISMLVKTCVSLMLLGRVCEADQHPWDNLRVTFPEPPHGQGFFAQPRTEGEAVEEGFEKISDCDVTSPWRGSRYVRNNDYGVILLYDVNGYIAGIQTSIPKGRSDGYPASQLQPPFVDDGENFVSSVYFVEPSIICARGRSEEEFLEQGTGTGVYIQNTSQPEGYLHAPLHEEDAPVHTSQPEGYLHAPLHEEDAPVHLWQQKPCYDGMGVHYIYDPQPRLTPENLFPVFLLYTNGSLNAFGWAIIATSVSHPSLERIPRDSQRHLIGNTTISGLPEYFYTLHVYLTDKPWENRC